MKEKKYRTVKTIPNHTDKFKYY